MSVAATDVVGKLRATFDSGRTRSVDWRIRQLRGLERMLTEAGDDLVAALGLDMAKPAAEAHFTDIAFTLTEVRHLRRNVTRWSAPRRANLRPRDRPGTGRVVPEPLGVSLVISPWNYPVQLAVSPIAASLAAGNVVVLKPSELVPATSHLLAELLPRYVDARAIEVVEGGPEVATALLAENLDHVLFTGSTTVGRIVAEAAARQLTPTVMELGGKSPVVVTAEADLATAATRIAWGKGVNAGQTCIAPDYVLVDRRVRDELCDGIVAAFGRFYGSDPTLSDDLAAIVNDQHLARVTELLEDHGGTIACGGTHDAATRRVAPTVIVDPNPASPLMTNEIFAPVLPVVGVDDLDAAIRFVNARPKPLALYVFGSDDEIDRVVECTSSGGVCANHVMFHIGPPDLPFGGVGNSGWGRYHGRSGFDAFSNLKAVYRRPLRPELSFVYPPYTRIKSWLLSR